MHLQQYVHVHIIVRQRAWGDATEKKWAGSTCQSQVAHMHRSIAMVHAQKGLGLWASAACCIGNLHKKHDTACPIMQGPGRTREMLRRGAGTRHGAGNAAAVRRGL